MLRILIILGGLLLLLYVRRTARNRARRTERTPPGITVPAAAIFLSYLVFQGLVRESLRDVWIVYTAIAVVSFLVWVGTMVLWYLGIPAGSSRATRR